MSEKNTIVFHIGTGKTGTTALQNFLEMNNEQLKQKGWIYPTGKDSDSPIRIWDQRFFGGNGGCLLANNGRLFDVAFDEILEYARQYNVIISSEGIWDRNWVPFRDKKKYARIEEFFSKVLERYDNVKVVVYLRRQDELLESGYNESVKRRERVSLTISDFMEGVNFKDPFLNYFRKLQSLEKIVGDRLTVRRYSKDIISDFLSVIGVELKDAKMPLVDGSNLSLGSRLLEIKRIMNGFKGLPASYEDRIIRLNQDNVNSGRKDYHKIMSPEMRRDILKEYEADNEEIARRYIKDGKPLFEDMNVDIPCKEYRATPLEEEMIRVFFNFITNLEKQIKNMPINMFRGDRKLAYFGAGVICRECLDIGISRPDVIVDHKGGREIDGIPVVSFNEMENWRDYYIIITTTRFKSENVKRLQEHGLTETQDYLVYCDML